MKIKLRDYIFNDGYVVTTTEIVSLELDDFIIKVKATSHCGLAKIIDYSFKNKKLKTEEIL